MTDDWHSIRVTAEAYEEAKAQKEKHGRTWSEQLTTEEPEVIEVVDAAEVIDEVVNAIDTAAFNGSISDDRADEIIGRLDDLKTSIPRKTARQLQQ